MGALNTITKILVIIGALNWLLVGINSFTDITYDWDLVALTLESIPWLAAIVYTLIGLSGIYGIFAWFKN